MCLTFACNEDDTYYVYYNINNQTNLNLKIITFSSFEYIYNDTIFIPTSESKQIIYDVIPKMNIKYISQDILYDIYDSIKIEVEDQVVKNHQHNSPIFNIDNWEFIQNEESFDAYYYLTNDSLDL
ncbi:hypothetical protein [Plebeiibacterium sediminum]|uniref:Uncharacterized protein n=1 Tax=Plebeiibacterium sediminum TaxID=2992112 RepID=A0AAE3M5N1_9BACT|nr:hypothetical protein [Plebeiobacterium sediminum]MCW3787280.1 hypothetical protein [Plebeiobacterium sediminum]